MNYVRKLGFEETPDYDFLRDLFSKVLKSLGEQDDGIFDWMELNGGSGGVVGINPGGNSPNAGITGPCEADSGRGGTKSWSTGIGG